MIWYGVIAGPPVSVSGVHRVARSRLRARTSPSRPQQAGDYNSATIGFGTWYGAVRAAP